ncbi:hypothetical protein CN063_27910 [Sinorhizobium meliloti]|uniref:hypothetical protein n=1 Tax=Rhizobium meliloti TaxID=382 RepID=UPI000FD6CE62|nr:hypothetical protein [Sinorhizobium meliloti]MDX0297980.1 hypothetical protein [Sinorhizobium meliloti]RVO81082.1 hypothetical protein CN088_27530 [Sinorhizobium meliloti]RVQ09100.1 hypothetical protein CN063_27910 [Sinorhizobium meliloti]
MSADRKKAVKLESQPVKAISMPEYRFQDYVTTEHFSSIDRSRSEERDGAVDLRGVALNLS